MEMDKSGGFIPAHKMEQGTVKKRDENGIIREYNIDLEDDDELLGNELESMDVGTVDFNSVRTNKPKTNRLEYQIEQGLNKQVSSKVDSYVDKVLGNDKIRIILSKKANWIKDDDYVNVIVRKVLEASGNRFIFEDVKQSIKNKYDK
jgi:hypothetical protein